MNHASGTVAPLDPELIQVTGTVGQRAQRRGPGAGVRAGERPLDGLVPAGEDRAPVGFVGTTLTTAIAAECILPREQRRLRAGRAGFSRRLYQLRGLGGVPSVRDDSHGVPACLEEPEGSSDVRFPGAGFIGVNGCP